MSIKKIQFIIVLGGVAGACFCHGGVVAQLDARHGVAAGTNFVWRALQEGVGLVAENSDWRREGSGALAGVVNHHGAEAGPLVFDGAVTGKNVRVVVMLVRAGDSLRIRETLVCSREIFRLAGLEAHDAGEGLGVAEFERHGTFSVASWKVDGVEGAGLVAGRTQLVEVTFKQGVEMSRVGLGSDLGRREWKRGFGGAFCELLAFEEVPPEAVMRAVRHYLRLKWRVPLALPPLEPGDVAEGRKHGVRFGSTFATILIISSLMRETPIDLAVYSRGGAESCK